MWRRLKVKINTDGHFLSRMMKKASAENTNTTLTDLTDDINTLISTAYTTSRENTAEVTTAEVTTVLEDTNQTRINGSYTYTGTIATLGNTTVLTDQENSNGTILIAVGATVGGVVFIMLVIATYLILMHIFVKRNKKLSKNRRSLSQVYVNQDIIAHSDDCTKSGIPRNLSWKSLEHSNMQENNIYSIRKIENVDTENRHASQNRLPDNYFILEKEDFNNDLQENSQFYINVPINDNDLTELNTENNHSQHRLTDLSEIGQDGNESSKQSQIVDSGRASIDDGEADEIYNRLGERSRNNSSTTENYDSMSNILMNQLKMEEDHIYCNDEDYSENCTVMKYKSNVSNSGNYNVLNFGTDVPSMTTGIYNHI